MLSCLGVFVPSEYFSLMWRRHHYRWRTANCNRVWHRIRGHVTLTPVAKHLSMELSLPALATYVCGGWDSNIQLSVNGLADCTITAAYKTCKMFIMLTFDSTHFPSTLLWKKWLANTTIYKCNLEPYLHTSYWGYYIIISSCSFYLSPKKGECDESIIK